MKVRLDRLVITTRRTTESLDFSSSVTFLYGPVGTGKSTVARLIDYCLGGDLERTPAVQQEFVAAQLHVHLGGLACTLERSASDNQSVRVSWAKDDDAESINAPLDAGDSPIFGGDIYNLSDLLFYLCGVLPIKVRKRARDPDSPMIRLSFRDIWWYCYLDQTHLDSSFYKLEDPFRGRKSQDAMRFFTGLHSERLSQLETDLYRAVDDQRGKREGANQIRGFMDKFQLGTEIDVEAQIERVREELRENERRKTELESTRFAAIHPTDALRTRLREMGAQIADLAASIEETESSIAEQRALKSELVMAKVKSGRVEQAGTLLSGVDYVRCPRCAADLTQRRLPAGVCHLCCTETPVEGNISNIEQEAVRREINDRIDQISDSIQRRERALSRSIRQLRALKTEKSNLDQVLEQELIRYDSAFVESVRSIDRESATLSERVRSLEKLQEMPRAISELEDQATALQGTIDRTRQSIDKERERLRHADQNVAALADSFKSIMLAVGFPGVSTSDDVVIDPRTWRPVILHSGQEWTFWDAGSGGKKTLFNVCYALAIHETARNRNLPVPSVLIIDSPTKNISEDENPELVKSLYKEIYRLASEQVEPRIQFLLIDSDLVPPEGEFDKFSWKHLAGTSDAPCLIPYYSGP